MSIPPSTTHRLMMDKDSGLRRHTSALKPNLTDENKMSRVLYALSKVDGETYKSMEDEIHVDEKWFYLTRDTESYILLDDEADPVRSVRHKSHIDKVMFLAATAKPRYDHQKKVCGMARLASGPLRVRSLPSEVRLTDLPEPWSGKHTMSTERSIVRCSLRKYFQRFRRSGLAERWRTRNEFNRITLQFTSLQMIPEWLAAVATANLSVELYNQPPNSPDTNINDLAFFVAIQSLQHKIGAGNNKETLIESVLQASTNIPMTSLRNAFLTLQCCLNSIIEHHGGNDYKIRHMNKAQLEREGKLPTNVFVTDAADQFLRTSSAAIGVLTLI